jgi:hypothetical protein
MNADERMEHICTLSEGVSKCHICEKKFPTQELALEHLKNIHNIDNEQEGSSDDEYNEPKVVDHESESDGSSGVDEDESDDGGESEEDDSDDDVKISKGRVVKLDSEEIKGSVKLVAEYMEVLKAIKIPAKLLELQRNL